MAISMEPPTDEVLSTAKEQLKDQGFCIVPDVLDTEAVKFVLERLWAAAEVSEKWGSELFIPALDPNSSNVRVFYLMVIDPVFRELIQHPIALALARLSLGDNILISNFTANIAKPGSKSMALHSDMSLVAPEPWLQPWFANIMWCLSDIYFENGSTLYIPGSHKWQRRADVPDNAKDLLQPFTTKAGSIIALDGRVWHTSGENITKDVDRPLIFGAYSVSFLRQQVNWTAALSQEIKDSLSPEMRDLLGVNITANTGVVTDIGIGLEKYEPNKAAA